jgi:hypothetical protein
MDKGKGTEPYMGKNRAEDLQKKIGHHEDEGIDHKGKEPRGQGQGREQKNPGYPHQRGTGKADEKPVFEMTVSPLLFEAVLTLSFSSPEPVRKINGRTQRAHVTAKDSPEEKGQAQDDQCPSDPGDKGPGGGHGTQRNEGVKTQKKVHLKPLRKRIGRPPEQKQEKKKEGKLKEPLKPHELRTSFTEREATSILPRPLAWAI